MKKLSLIALLTAVAFVACKKKDLKPSMENSEEENSTEVTTSESEISESEEDSTTCEWLIVSSDTIECSGVYIISHTWDYDGDGIADASSYDDALDSDGDGIPDEIENLDADGDCVFDEAGADCFWILISAGDSIIDGEFYFFLDWDYNDDGIADATSWEGDGDLDGDVTIDMISNEIDDDYNGIPDGIEALDSDGDCILD